MLADRDQQIQKLFADGLDAVSALNGRSNDIEDLLTNATRVSRELTGVARDNSQQIGPPWTSSTTCSTYCITTRPTSITRRIRARSYCESWVKAAASVPPSASFCRTGGTDQPGAHPAGLFTGGGK